MSTVQNPPKNPAVTTEHLQLLLAGDTPIRRGWFDIYQFMLMQVVHDKFTPPEYGCRETLLHEIRTYFGRLGIEYPETISLILRSEHYNCYLDDDYDDYDDYVEYNSFQDIFYRPITEHLSTIANAVSSILFQKPVQVTYNNDAYTLKIPGDFLHHPALLHFLTGVLRESVTHLTVGHHNAYDFSDLAGDPLKDWKIMAKVFANFRATDFYTEDGHIALFWALARWGVKCIIGDQSPKEVWDLKKVNNRYVTLNQSYSWYWGRDGIEMLQDPYAAEVDVIMDELRDT